jgi:hypothetical protein
MGWGFWSKDVDVEVDEAISPLDGIIAHLTRECGGNVAEHRLVRITRSSVRRDDAEFAAKNAADLGSDSVFYSGSEPEQWLCYQFSDMVVIPTHYSIRAGGEMSPRNWVVEGREWGGDWLELDRREKDDSLKSQNVMGTFQVSRTAEVSQIRLRQTGWNHGRTDCLVVSSFEIFGSVVRTMRWREFPRELAKGNTFLSKVTRIGSFPPSMKKRKLCRPNGHQTDEICDIPDGIIAHLTRKCGGNVHDRHVVDVTCGSFEKETQSASNVAKNAADLESSSVFLSAYRSYQEHIQHARNSWVCEADRLELDCREKDDLLNRKNVTGTFAVSRSA